MSRPLAPFIVVAAFLVPPFAAGCGPETIVVNMGGGPPSPSDADREIPGNASDSSAPPSVAEAGDAGPTDRDAARGSADAASRMDSGTDDADAGLTVDASRIDAGVPSADAGIPSTDAGRVYPPDPGVYGCTESPFNADGTVCLVHEACENPNAAPYLASATFECASAANPSLLTCWSDSPINGPGEVPAPLAILTVSQFSAFPFRLRTPKVTGPRVACASECAGVASEATASMRFAVALPFAAELAVRVGPPWKVAFNLPRPFCVPTATNGTAACAAMNVQTATITIYTTEIYAPSRNVLVDVAARTPCP